MGARCSTSKLQAGAAEADAAAAVQVCLYRSVSEAELRAGNRYTLTRSDCQMQHRRANQRPRCSRSQRCIHTGLSRSNDAVGAELYPQVNSSGDADDGWDVTACEEDELISAMLTSGPHFLCDPSGTAQLAAAMFQLTAGEGAVDVETASQWIRRCPGSKRSDYNGGKVGARLIELIKSPSSTYIQVVCACVCVWSDWMLHRRTRTRVM